jgi:hypothetical protein
MCLSLDPERLEDLSDCCNVLCFMKKGLKGDRAAVTQCGKKCELRQPLLLFISELTLSLFFALIKLTSMEGSPSISA